MVNTKQSQQGFSSIELLLAAAIMVIVFSSVILLVLGSQKIATDSQLAHEAEQLNQTMLESARQSLLANFSSDVTALATPTTVGIYSKSLSQYNVSGCVKEVTARVQWTIEGRAQFVTNTTQVSDPTVPFVSGTECNTGATGQWEGCFLAGSVDLPGGGDHDAYDLDVTRIAGVKYVFLATHPHNSSQAPEDFWIYNINSSTSPVFVNKLDLNGDGNIGLNSLVVAKDNATGSYYAYAGVDDNKNQFIVLNVSNPASLGAPIIININGFGNNVVVKDVKFFGGFVYLAIGNTVQVFNVTNPLVPTGPVAINLGGLVNKLAVDSNYIYAATDSNNAELVRVNRSNYATQVNYNASGNQDGTAVWANGSTVYLGRASHSTADLIALSSSGAGLTVLGSRSINHQNNTEIINLIVVGRFAFIASTDSNQEFEVYDVSNPLSMVKKCINPSVNPPNIGFGLDFFENLVYLAMRSNSELQIYSDQSP